MADMDSILSIVENPTRRRILQALVREPHYPLQLSHELGVSQQAIMKNLALMEREGLLECYRESSNIGPDRTFYKPTSEFSIVIDMRGNMFEVRMTTPGPALPPSKVEEEEKSQDMKKEFDEVRMRIASIDKKLAEFEIQRQQLVRERSQLIEEFLKGTDLRRMNYEYRGLLYAMLNRPNGRMDDIARETGLNNMIISSMIDELMDYFKKEMREE